MNRSPFADNRLTLVPLLALSLSACMAAQPPVSTAISAQQQALGISAVPDDLASTYSTARRFNRYTSVVAANGKAIHIVAQDGLTDGQIIRARAVLQHYLTNFAGSEFGSDKTAVANQMASNGATLMLLNGSDDGRNPAAGLDGQPLYHDEIQVEGGPWYMRQDYEHRDATYEEILHLVHDYGIGVDGDTYVTGALPGYQAEIRAAQVAALDNNIWGIGSEARPWLEELSEENSLSQEYLASVADAYYGLWGPFSDQRKAGSSTSGSDGHGMWGIYIAGSRAQIAQNDAKGSAVMEAFFHPYLTYNARIDASFNGTFSLRFEPHKPYTHHSRYLTDITLTGSNPSGVVVNQLDNRITGNVGRNTVIFSGPPNEYRIHKEADLLQVTDSKAGRDGVNMLADIEELRFSDGSVLDVAAIK
jgi:hypothetical protein